MAVAVRRRAVKWYAVTVREHAEADARCGRQWSCCCGACKCARRDGWTPRLRESETARARVPAEDATRGRHTDRGNVPAGNPLMVRRESWREWGSGRCCEQSLKIEEGHPDWRYCVCAYLAYCPDHGLAHVGTHE